MAENKFVVSGEAPESDEESCKDEESRNIKSYGMVVNGEAIESDDELVSYAAESREKSPMKGSNSRRSLQSNCPENDSILQKRLCDTNAKLWKDLNICLYSAIFASSRELLNTDQQLLKSQVVLQSISYNFKASETATSQMLAKTKDIVFGNFIPSINI